MESLQNIKRRLKGVENIGKITKAMELVAATKMRRSQEIAIASRPYAFSALELLANLSTAVDPELVERAPLLMKRPIKRTLIVLVTSDKGLCGSFNSAIIRKFEKLLREYKIETGDPQYFFAAVGGKASRYLSRKFGTLVGTFVRFGDYTTLEEVKPLSEFLVKGYLEKKWDRVLVFSTHFRSALRQEVFLREVLPVDVERLRETAREMIPETGRFAELMRERGMEFFKDAANGSMEYLIEPSPQEVLETLVPYLIEMQIYHLILEANASEHAARRLAMKNASDNASELSSELTLFYNKARQAAITRELIEIAAGAESLK